MALRIVLDTNAYSDWRRQGTWNELICRATQVMMPTMVLGELHGGFQLGLTGRENQAKLAKFLGEESVRVISPSEVTAEIYGDFYAFLHKQGTPLPTNDLWIGALTYEHKAVLVTRDRHFSRLPQVPLHSGSR